MSRPAKTHDNAKVHAYLVGILSVTELAEHIPEADDIFTGVLELKTGGCTSTRTLSRKVLFRILQRCPCITVEAVRQATGRQYAQRTLEMYAALARVASKALEGAIARLPEGPLKPTLRDDRKAIDAPYDERLQALGLTWPFRCREFPQPKGEGRPKDLEFPQPKGEAPWMNKLWEFNFNEAAVHL